MGCTGTHQQSNNIKDLAQSIVHDIKECQSRNKNDGHKYWEIINHQLIDNTLFVFAERINAQDPKEKHIFAYLLDESDGRAYIQTHGQILWSK